MGSLTIIFGVPGIPALADDASRIELSMPIDCGLGDDCFVQNYVDVEPGNSATDFRCGKRTYDGHKGTDFRLLTLKAARNDIPVLAAAPGRVKATRDGMPDRLLKESDRAALRGRECGNGVVIEHEGGWQTQYCHLRKSSVRVRTGEEVERGQRIASVGYSGAAQFAHVHLAVRRDGVVHEPFTGRAVGGEAVASACKACGRAPGAPLWRSEIIEAIGDPRGQIIDAGFTGGVLSPENAERGRIVPAAAGAPILLFYGRYMNLEKGDRIRMTLAGPGANNVDRTSPPLDRAKAHWIAFVGRKLKGEAWSTGEYSGETRVLRNGEVHARRSASFTIE